MPGSGKSHSDARAGIIAPVWLCKPSSAHTQFERKRHRLWRSKPRLILCVVVAAVTGSAPQLATADVLMFHSDGSVSASGWTFHGTPPENTTEIGPRGGDQQREPVRPNGTAAPKTEIVAAVRATAERHKRNRAIRAAGLGTRDWHQLFYSLIEAESAFNPSARSPKGAIGLGQLMPATARQLGVDPHDINQNLDGAARYLLTQLAAFGTVELALAAYNAGPHRIAEYGGVPPFRETRNYIARIDRLTGGLVRQAAADPALDSTSNSTLRTALVLD